MIAAQDAVTTPAMVVLRRGDRVLITMVEEPSEEDAFEYMRGLHGAFPGVEFVILGGVAGLALLAGEPKGKDPS